MSQDGVGRTSAFLSGVGSMRRGWRPPSTPTQKAAVTRRRTAVTKVFIDTSSFSSVTREVSSVTPRGSIDLHAAREAVALAGPHGPEDPGDPFGIEIARRGLIIFGAQEAEHDREGAARHR